MRELRSFPVDEATYLSCSAVLGVEKHSLFMHGFDYTICVDGLLHVIAHNPYAYPSTHGRRLDISSCRRPCLQVVLESGKSGTAPHQDRTRMQQRVSTKRN